ncbi:hypothetical protein KCP74_09725 [Salmonella enterica subsp. enterica]|nr:hypothetical protein KCP74_09725 [Salmonella enterica subsp. enterica]
MFRIRFPSRSPYGKRRPLQLAQYQFSNGTRNDTAFIMTRLCHGSGKRAEPSIKNCREIIVCNFTARRGTYAGFQRPSS